MIIDRTQEEIENKLDELAYFDFCFAQSGGENVKGTSQLMMLNWLLNTDYDKLYERGEKLYRSGVRYTWNKETREYIKENQERRS